MGRHVRVSDLLPRQREPVVKANLAGWFDMQCVVAVAGRTKQDVDTRLPDGEAGVVERRSLQGRKFVHVHALRVSHLESPSSIEAPSGPDESPQESPELLSR